MARQAADQPPASSTTGVWSVRTTTGRRMSRPTTVRLEQLASALPRGAALIAEQPARPEQYAQAWLQPQGLWQLEVRVDADHHWRTTTASVDRVAGLLHDWAHRRTPEDDARGWQDEGWQNIARLLS